MSEHEGLLAPGWGEIEIRGLGDPQIGVTGTYGRTATAESGETTCIARQRSSGHAAHQKCRRAAIEGLSGATCTGADGGAGATAVRVDNAGAITLTCIFTDAFEPNDTRSTAHPLARTEFPVMATLSPANDEDWYDRRAFTGAIRITGGPLMDVYRNETSTTAEATNVTCTAGPTFIRVSGPPAAYELQLGQSCPMPR
jgi:hypothetical protein